MLFYSLQSIGFVKVKIDSLSFTNVKDLFETLVPPALFVAVMAIQLKYFTPLDEAVEEAMAQNSMNGEEDSSSTPKLLRRFIKYLQVFSEFCWRFLEVYLDKIIAIVTFVLVLQQVSSTHVITLLILLGPIIGLRATRVWYPILTLYTSVLIILKMLYQVRMVDVDTFDLTDDCHVSNRVAIEPLLVHFLKTIENPRQRPDLESTLGQKFIKQKLPILSLIVVKRGSTIFMVCLPLCVVVGY